LYTTCSPHVLQKEDLLTKIYLYQQQSKAERSNERTEQRTAPEEDFYDYGSIHLPFCLVAVVISVAAAATRPPPPLPSRRQLDEQDCCCCWWLLIHEEASGASFLSSGSHSSEQRAKSCSHTHMAQVIHQISLKCSGNATMHNAPTYRQCPALHTTMHCRRCCLLQFCTILLDMPPC
jgi:hypothetical protein